MSTQVPYRLWLSGAAHVTSTAHAFRPKPPDPRRDPRVLTVACSYCGALPNKPCWNTHTGRRFKIPHATRVKDAHYHKVLD